MPEVEPVDLNRLEQRVAKLEARDAIRMRYLGRHNELFARSVAAHRENDAAIDALVAKWHEGRELMGVLSQVNQEDQAALEAARTMASTYQEELDELTERCTATRHAANAVSAELGEHDTAMLLELAEA